MRRPVVVALLGGCPIVAIAASIGCKPAFRACDPVPAARLAALPSRLSETGLFASTAPATASTAEMPSTETLGEGVRAFTPRFPLWTDGATKRRWIRLPPGGRIDVRDPDAWVFPRGTRVWKEFSRAGVRVETRMLDKLGDAPDAWTGIAYVWRDDGDAHAAAGGEIDARGTAHDVPTAAQCPACHAAGPSALLGFSAIQLPSRLPTTGDESEWTIASLVAAGVIDEPDFRELPDIPGDATTQAALGYLHANCSHCHHGARPPHDGARCFDPESPIDFTLRVGELATPEATATYRTAVGVVIDPVRPDASEVMERLRSRDPWWSMPALGTEQVDAAGARVVEAWIRGLPPR